MPRKIVQTKAKKHAICTALMRFATETSLAGGNGRLLNLVLGALFIRVVQNSMNLMEQTLASVRSALRPERFLHDAVPVPAWRRGRLQGSG